MEYNRRLHKLQEKIFAKRSLEAKLNELGEQKSELENRVLDLKTTLRCEQNDVDRLERASLSSVFYSLLGKKDDMLDKEKREACTAKLRYDSAVQELEYVKDEISRINSEIMEISDCEGEYNELIEQKLNAIKASHSADAERIFSIEEEIAEQESQQKEIGEAVSAGEQALRTVDSILISLGSAEDWGTLDMLGGGMFSSIAKHSHLDEAQIKVNQLQNELRRFKTELADITIQTDMQLSIDGFLRFADCFFDNMFVDLAVMDQINQSQASVQDTKHQIETLIAKLKDMDADTESRIKQLHEEKDSVVASASI